MEIFLRFAKLQKNIQKLLNFNYAIAGRSAALFYYC